MLLNHRAQEGCPSTFSYKNVIASVAWRQNSLGRTVEVCFNDQGLGASPTVLKSFFITCSYITAGED